MPVRALPQNPNLQHLKYQAKDLLKGHAARDAAVAQRIREFHPRWSKATDAAIFEARFQLNDAQLTIAREYGFASWARLKRRIEKPKPSDEVNVPLDERIQDPAFRRAVDLMDAGNVEGLRLHLSEHPKLARQRVEFEGVNYFRNPTLLEFIAENPIRRGKVPGNVVEIAEVIVAAGVEQSSLDGALGLVVTGCVTRECGVQIPLINLLCDRGADPDGAVEGAAVGFELDAAKALLRRGARMTLTIAVALRDLGEARRLLPEAGAELRHLAFAVAAQYGHIEMVGLLLDAGEDPNRFNPVGAHSHSTPLHQAAWNGHLEVVKLLVERGAKLDTRDILWDGTPAGWANHAGRKDVEEYLRSAKKPKS